MPCQKKTLATTAVSTAARIRVKRVNANPVVPVNTFAVDSWNIENITMPPIVEATTAEISNLLKLSDRLFNLELYPSALLPEQAGFECCNPLSLLFP